MTKLTDEEAATRAAARIAKAYAIEDEREAKRLKRQSRQAFLSFFKAIGAIYNVLDERPDYLETLQEIVADNGWAPPAKTVDNILELTAPRKNG